MASILSERVVVNGHANQACKLCDPLAIQDAYGVISYGVGCRQWVIKLLLVMQQANQTIALLIICVGHVVNVNYSYMEQPKATTF